MSAAAVQFRLVRRLFPGVVAFFGAVSVVLSQPANGPPIDPPGLAISVHRLSDLEFGTVTAGRQRSVLTADPEAAAFEVDAPRGRDILIQWDLPLDMGGVPITFEPNSAAWAETASAAQQISFDPRHDFSLHVPPSGTFFLWLGGIAAPLPQQESGAFTGDISLTITLEHD